MSEPSTPKLTVSRFLLVIFVFAVAIFLQILSYSFFFDTTSLNQDVSLENIKERGSLIVLTENNANAYYLYRDTPMGFEYELVKAFANHLGVSLVIKTPGWSQLFNLLQSGQGDLMAAGITITPERESLAAFSDSYMPVRQQVVVHKHNYDIKAITDLEGYIIHVRKDTTYEKRLKEIQQDGIKLTIVSHKDMPTEELIQLVAAGEIPVTIADSNIAKLNRRYYPDIKIAFDIEEEQQLAWAVRRKDQHLLDEINIFFQTIKKNGVLNKIHNHYYAMVDDFDYVDLKKFHRRLRTRLPEYRNIIEAQAEKYGFDWRLIAAVIYQESHFNPWATSYTGVQGIMQLTETTAAELGVSDRFDPIQSIQGGVRYLAKMRGLFKEIKDPHTRLLFALASYNIGYGHVRDAQQLAIDLGLEKNSWQALSTTLPLLRNKKYYATTRYGYARGTEPVRYIKRVLTYYDILKRKALPDSMRI